MLKLKIIAQHNVILKHLYNMMKFPINFSKLTTPLHIMLTFKSIAQHNVIQKIAHHDEIQIQLYNLMKILSNCTIR